MKLGILSKSSFGLGQQCHKRLWIEKHDRGLVPDLSYKGMVVVEAGIERAKLIGADGE